MSERVDETIDYEIEDDEVQRLKLTPTGEFETIQQIEIPSTPVIVTEHRFPLYESPKGDLYYPYAPEVHGKPPLKRNRAVHAFWPPFLSLPPRSDRGKTQRAIGTFAAG